jgi:hypothetical protein
MGDVEKLVFKKLDVDNYATWSAKMRSLLTIKGYEDAITEAANVNSKKALALSTLCVEDHHLTEIAGCQDAKAAWDTLAAAYRSRSVAKQLQLRKELNTLKMAPGEPVTKYISRARSIRDQLQAAGHPTSDSDVVLAVLSGLPEQYSMLVTVLETADQTPNLDDVLSKALLVEQRMCGGGTTDYETPVKAFYASGDNKEPEEKACYYCKKKGHLKRDCRKWRHDREANNRYGEPQSCSYAIAL